MTRSAQMELRRRWLELRLLCRPNIGLAAIAPPVCRLAREIVGADAASLFWLDPQGMPLGFFHEDSPLEVRDLFVNEFERLFVGENEINVFSLANAAGAPCGTLIAPSPDYFRSNTHNLLVRPSGHHHSLDLRVDGEDGGRAVLLLFRDDRAAFTDRDAATLTLFDPLLRRAGTSVADTKWTGADGASGHLIVDGASLRIVAMSDGVEALLRNSNLVGRGLSLTGPLQTPPRFIAELCRHASRTGSGVAQAIVPAGRLAAEASSMRAPGSDPALPPQILVTLRHEAPTGMAAIAPILERRLSPLRSEILLYAATGGGRDTLSQTFGISKEAAKKHLAAIYRTIGVGRWEDIPAGLLPN